MCVIWSHGNDLRFWAEFLLHASFPTCSFPSFSGRNHESMKAHGSVWTGVTWAATAAEYFGVFMWFVQAVLEKAQPPQHDGNDPAFPHLCLSDFTIPQQERPVSRGMPFPPGPTRISVCAPPFPAVIRAATQRKHEITERNSSLEWLSWGWGGGGGVWLAVWAWARDTKVRPEQTPAFHSIIPLFLPFCATALF